MKRKSTKELHIRPMGFGFGLDYPLDYARMIQREYAEGHIGHLAAFLQCAYYAYFSFRRGPVFLGQVLKHDDYWDSWREKQDSPIAKLFAYSPKFYLGRLPHSLTTSKWVLRYLMQATTPEAKRSARRFSVILDEFAHDEVPVEAVAKRITALGGAKEAYKAMLARDRGTVVKRRIGRARSR
jgi:hypothetical protein